MPTATNSTDKLRRRGAQREEKRREIIEETKKLLLRYGNRATTMDEIANAAGLATASLYRYFPLGKDELYEEIIDTVLALDEKALKPALDSDAPPVEKLIEVGVAYVGFALEHPGWFQLLATPKVFGSLTDEQAERIATRVGHLIDRVAEVIELGKSADLPVEQRIAEHLDSRKTAEFLHGAWNGLLELSVRADDLERTDDRLLELAALGTDLVQNGMMSRRLDKARAVALDMALAGQSHEAIDAALQDEFSLMLENVLRAEPE